jgi:hypothetical protein
MISQYFIGDMMPDRAIHMQRCKQFRSVANPTLAEARRLGSVRERWRVTRLLRLVLAREIRAREREIGAIVETEARRGSVNER